MTRIIKFFKVLGIVLCSILIISFLFILIYSKIGNSKIQADIEGLGTRLIGISSNSIDRTEDHAKIVFSFKGKINAKISLKNTSEVNVTPLFFAKKRIGFNSRPQRIYFHLDPDSEIIIKGKSSDLSIDYDIIKGNVLSFQYSELRKIMLPYLVEESRLYNEQNVLRKTNPEESNRIYKQFDSLRLGVLTTLRTEWAKRHLNYELAPRYFLESHVPKDSVIKYFSLLPKNVRESEYGQILEGIVTGWAKTLKGESAPNFEQYTNLNEPFELAVLKGKYVVLDFWGSWCGPCIAGIPKMKEYYDKYNDKLEIVGIACNDKKNDWEKAIREYQLNWINILNDKSIIDISTLYGVTSYPTKFIIDKDGKIMEKFVGEGADFYKMINEIMQQ